MKKKGENRGDIGDGDVEVNGEIQDRGKSSEAIGSTREDNEGILVKGREKRPPYWTEDCVSGEGLSEEEEAMYMVQDATKEYPTSFENAIREDK